MVESYAHIKYAKNVLKQKDFEELQEYIGDSVGDWPAYNFKPKNISHTLFYNVTHLPFNYGNNKNWST